MLCFPLDVLVNLLFPNSLVDGIGSGIQDDRLWNHEFLFVFQAPTDICTICEVATDLLSYLFHRDGISVRLLSDITVEHVSPEIITSPLECRFGFRCCCRDSGASIVPIRLLR
jgi:hypothetical protein